MRACLCFASLAVVAAAFFMSLPGCGDSDGPKVKRIILLTNGDDPFWDVARAGMEKAAAELNLEDAGYRVVVDKGDGSAAYQIDKLKQYAGQTDVAAVAISVTEADSGGLADAMKRLREAGIKVITIDSDTDREQFRDARFAYLGTNNVIGGRQLGRAAKVLLPDGGKYVTFVGLKSAANAVERINGFAEGAGETFEERDSMEDKIKHPVAQQNVKTAMGNHPDLNLLVGIWAYNAHAIVAVVDELEIRDQVKVVVFDAAERALLHMGNGKIDAMVVQNPYQMGYLGTKLMKAMIDDDGAAIKELLPDYDVASKKFTGAEGDIYTTELRVVVPDDGSPLRPEHFNSDVISREKNTFFYLDEFKKWLADRNITSS